MKHILFFTNETSDKEYHVWPAEREDGSGWDCLCSYGRRGKTGKAVPKNKEALTETAAREMADHIALSQVFSGYTTDPSGTPGSGLASIVPGYVKGMAKGKAIYSEDAEPDWLCYGKHVKFSPGGLPHPDWFVACYPGDPDSTPTVDMYNEGFEPYNNDADIMLLKDISMEEAKERLWKMACKDFKDNVECDNGAAYCLWEIPGHGVVVGGFDNGGSDLAEDSVRKGFKDCATEYQISDAHFHPESSDIAAEGPDRDLLNMLMTLPVAREREKLNAEAKEGKPREKKMI